MTINPNQFFSIEFDSKRDPEILAMMHKIYPALSEEQLLEAKDNLESYLKRAWKIAVRLEEEAQGGVFDNASNNSYDTEQRSNPIKLNH